MNVQHDLHGIRLRFVEDLFEDRHHEVPRGVVVIVQQHPEHRGPLQLFLGLGPGLGDRPGVAGIWLVALLRHPSTRSP